MSKYVLPRLLLLTTVISLSIELLPEVFASSPSFPIQAIYTFSDDWHLLREKSIVKDIADCKEGQAFPFPRIEAISYLSDGKTLYTTLWLSSSFKDIEPTTEVFRRYAFTISIDSVYNAIQNYEVDIDWSSITNTWTMTVLQWSPIPGSNKVLYQHNNYSGFFEKEKNYVDLSLDLATVGNPNNYSVLSYAMETYMTKNAMCTIQDTTTRIHIPPPEFSLLTSPSSVVLSPDTEKNIELQIKSNTTLDSHISLSTNQIEGIESNFIPNEISVSPFSMATATLHVKVLKNATVGVHTLIVSANVSFPTTVTNLGDGSIGEIFSSKSVATITKDSYFTISVPEPLTFQEQIKSVWDAWGSPISGFYSLIAAIIAGISPWLIHRVKKKKDKNKKDWQ